ncbi:MAG: germination protein YpeB [Oscillospiraceae bacterium]|nr:germination protein YpeB [Oscillospiraceae bacterium]
MKKVLGAALTVCALAAAAVLGGFVYKNHKTAEFYRGQLEYCRMRALESLASEVGELDSALQKCVVSSSAHMAGQSLTRVFGAAETARQALGELPRGDTELLNTSGFISRVGDYALALTKKTSRGEALSPEERESLKKLSETASVLSGNLTELLGEVSGGRLTIGEIVGIEKRAQLLGESATEGSGGAFYERARATEEDFPELPTLVYDGPFSSHIAGMTPRLLEGRAELTSGQAQKIAADFIKTSTITYIGERGGSLPVYRFSSGDTAEAKHIEVTKQGGVVANMYSGHIPRIERVSAAAAVETAGRFLQERGFTDMRETYRMARGGILTISFAYEQAGVICYPDLIKTDVALDSGDVIGFEAQGYIMHHKNRELPQPAISEDAARAVLSPELTLPSHSLAVIPTEGKNEVFCHEFKCETADGEHCLVYINAETGAEESILILLEDENGTLAR